MAGLVANNPNDVYTTQTPKKGATVQGGAHVDTTGLLAIAGGLAALVYLDSTLSHPSASTNTVTTTTSTTATSVSVPSSPSVAVPGSPVSLTQTGSTTNSVSLSWAPVEGAAEYQIWQYSPRTLLGQTTTNQATLSNLQPNTHYEVFIVALNINGVQGSPSQPLLVITASSRQPSTVPSIPGGFTVKAVAADAITFSWLTTTGATYYQIKDVTTGQTSAPISGTEATISGLNPNTSYSFTLQACNNIGCSGESTLIQATTSSSSSSPTTSTTPPSAPSQVSVTGTGSTTVNLCWPAVSGAKSYTITDETTGHVLDSGITSTCVQITGLTPGTTYHFGVAACNSYGCGTAQTTTVSTQTQTTQPSTSTTSTPTTSTTSTVSHPTCPQTLPSSVLRRCGIGYLSMGEDPADPGHTWFCEYKDGTFTTGYDQPGIVAAGSFFGGYTCPSSSQPSCASTYTVQNGDTLWSIAQHFYGNGAYWHVLYAANTGVVGSNPNYIKPGERLCIPPSSAGKSAGTLPMPYVVQSGDTLSGLALKFYGNANDYPAIAHANHIGPPYTIYIGQTLTIPALG